MIEALAPPVALAAPRLSVIVPAWNEARELPGLFAALDAAWTPACELLLVDGESADGTAELARRPGVRVLEAPRGRASQQNAGARAARGEWLLFLHADTRPSPHALRRILALGPAAQWGHSPVVLAAPGRAFRLIEGGINLRSRAFATPSGDQGLFVRRALFEALGGFSPVPLCEDLLLVDRLREAGGAPALLPEPVLTSARRWERGGVAATVARMWAIRLAFRLGVAPARLARFYR
ncbi:MAG: TIGR04283 family arsenosugar biosynthesis glycosyltransferase [Planctomycetota bacterium]